MRLLGDVKIEQGQAPGSWQFMASNNGTWELLYLRLTVVSRRVINLV